MHIHNLFEQSVGCDPGYPEYGLSRDEPTVERSSITCSGLKLDHI